MWNLPSSAAEPVWLIRLGADRISPALSCRCCRDTAGYRRPTPDGDNYYFYLLELLLLQLVLLLLRILLLLLRLLLLLLLQRPNEFHTESDRTIWCTGSPNNPLLDLHWVSAHQLVYCTWTTLPFIMIHG